ncbi:MAG: Tail-specific protease [Chlamydiae bacterium]|nr:Tail-specific protease [Chlamydiota bacterium]
MYRKLFFTLFLFLSTWTITEGKLPEIDSPKVLEKVHEIMKAHASYKEMSGELISRAFLNYLDELDPNKTYFILSDIEEYLKPSDEQQNRALAKFNQGDFGVFSDIHDRMIAAIHRRHEIEKKIDLNQLPEKVLPEEFKDMDWVSTEEELLTRLNRIKALQIETSLKLNEEFREKSLQRIQKHQKKYEEVILDNDPIHRKQLVLSNVLKATTAALDAHTAYFTPEEATQFMIGVQQRLFGIGAQLRDDLNGFSVIKIIEGGPAALGKQLKAKDRIVAVDGEPVVGMDIISAVELIRGKENTPVVLTVIREVGEDDKKEEEQLDITIIRAEVVLKETRFESSYEPFGHDAIGYLKLYSFYQDPESSSAKDLEGAIENLKKEHNLKGLVLDLRYNTGGLLSQAVDVTGLFIKKGVVVAIKDSTESIQYLRNLNGKMAWDGPLVVLVNRASASASEIVAQTLQDYGRAIIVGDDHTYGKGSFQTFTLNAGKEGTVNPEGEYKVTRGRYYTVSGKTPQLTGVASDIILPGPLSELDIGEKFSKYPLENDSIKANFDDDLSDVPYSQRQRIRALYKFDLQKILTTYKPYLENLKSNAEYRVDQNNNYQTFLKELKKDNTVEEETEKHFGHNDLQLTETYNIMKDLIVLMNSA